MVTMKKKIQSPIIPITLDLSTVTHDLLKFPWPYADASVESVSCIHKLEYIPARLRIPFMEELYRILIPSGKVTVIACYWTSPRSIQDPAVEWPPLAEQSFLYFNKGWRENNKLPPIKADFDFGYGYSVEPEVAGRNQESQAFWIKHYLNTATDLQLVLTKRGPTAPGGPA
jgi:hypothetical protein